MAIVYDRTTKTIKECIRCGSRTSSDYARDKRTGEMVEFPDAWITLRDRTDTYTAYLCMKCHDRD